MTTAYRLIVIGLLLLQAAMTAEVLYLLDPNHFPIWGPGPIESEVQK